MQKVRTDFTAELVCNYSRFPYPIMKPLHTYYIMHILYDGRLYIRKTTAVQAVHHSYGLRCDVVQHTTDYCTSTALYVESRVCKR